MSSFLLNCVLVFGLDSTFSDMLLSLSRFVVGFGSLSIVPVLFSGFVRPETKLRSHIGGGIFYEPPQGIGSCCTYLQEKKFLFLCFMASQGREKERVLTKGVGEKKKCREGTPFLPLHLFTITSISSCLPPSCSPKKRVEGESCQKDFSPSSLLIVASPVRLLQSSPCSPFPPKVPPPLLPRTFLLLLNIFFLLHPPGSLSLRLLMRGRCLLPLGNTGKGGILNACL